MCVCLREREREYVCVERERQCVVVCVCERERDSVCVCGERESVVCLRDERTVCV